MNFRQRIFAIGLFNRKAYHEVADDIRATKRAGWVVLGAALSCGVGLHGFRSALVLDFALSATAVFVFATVSTVLLSIKHGAQSWDAELSSKAIRMLGFSMAPALLGALGWVFGPGLTGVF